jgi:hypothetical protein
MPRRIDPALAPLSSTQQRLWTSGQSAKGTSYGNVPMAVRIRGPVNVDLVGRALSLVVARHEILRTTFVLEEARAVQRIHPAAPLRVSVEDLRAVPPADRERRLASRVEEESRRPFDPSGETLVRAATFRLDEAEWALLLVSHHLATDGWGARLLLDELAIAYASLVDGREPDLPRLVVQYGDYAAWEAEHLASGALEAQRVHWLARLAGAPRQLGLPYIRSHSGSVETESIKVSLPQDLATDLRRLSRARGVTPYVVLLAGLEIVLRQMTGEDDIVVGTILSRRTRSETEPLIGNFGNNLLLRTTLDGDPSLTDVVDRAAVTMRDALAHSDVPLELVAQAAPIPAFQMMFILRDGGLEERLTLSGATVEPIRASSGAATLDLIVDLTDGARGITGYIEYQKARFAPETMRQFATALEDVAARLVRDPSVRLSDLPVMRIEHAARVERLRAPGESPATQTERVLARLWSKMLDGETVYRNDNFFRLGGDSLGAVYVLEQAEKELGHRFRPEELSSATLAELAAACDGRTTTTAPRVDRDDTAMVRRVDPLLHADQIKDLFEREGMSHLRDFFDRTYGDAVKEGASSWVMFGGDDRVVGHIAMFPHRFTRDDDEFTGALGVNLVVDRHHRNLTSAMALVDRMVRDLDAQPDIDFLFGDPNDDARAIMSSLSGFRDIDILGRLVLPIDEPGVLGPVISLYLTLTLGRKGARPLELERRSAAAFDTAEIERPPGWSPALRPVRTPPLYPRRLTGYPSAHDDWYLFTRDAERVAAVLVRRLRADGRAQICCLWRHPDVAVAELVRPMVADLRERGVERLQTSVLRSSPLGRELRASGFRQREEGVRFGAVPCSPRGQALLDAGAEWEITDIDCDRGLDL